MFYERAKELVENAKSTNEKINQKLCKEFGWSSDKVSRQFKSLFGKTIRDTLNDKFTPTREQIEDALLKSSNVNEMKEILGYSKTAVAWKGLLDKEFGYSTYEKAKASFISKQQVADYNPTLADNISILYSQVLGDGNYDDIRGAIRIEHGYKQFEYLKLKVALIHKAFPESNTISDIKKVIRADTGYTSYTWYSKRFGTSYTNKLESKSKLEMLEDMTPLGWFLYYLDDGFLSGDAKTGQVVCGFSTVDNSLKEAIIKIMESQGIIGWNTDKGGVRLSSKISVALFLNNIVKPFEHLIPECMRYKLDMKI